MKNDCPKVGIVGAMGSLGSKLSGSVMETGCVLYCFDIKYRNFSGNNTQIWQSDINKLLNKSDIIHWCAPSSEAVKTIKALGKNKTLFLHESVMYESYVSKTELLKNKLIQGEIVIVHCLMNEQNSMVIDQTSKVSRNIKSHINALNFNSITMKIGRHDMIMARTQAPFAVLHELLTRDLRRLNKQGLLTPSGKALYEALEDREAKWTEATLKSILSNPKLPEFIEEFSIYSKKLLHDSNRLSRHK